MHIIKQGILSRYAGGFCPECKSEMFHVHCEDGKLDILNLCPDSCTQQYRTPTFNDHIVGIVSLEDGSRRIGVICKPEILKQYE